MKKMSLSLLLLCVAGFAFANDFRFIFLRHGPSDGTGWVHVDNSQVTPSTNDVLTVTVKFSNNAEYPLHFNLDVYNGGQDNEYTSATSGTKVLSVSDTAMNSATEFQIVAEIVVPDEATDQEAFDDFMIDFTGSSMAETRRIDGLTHNIRSAPKTVSMKWGATKWYRLSGEPHIIATADARSAVGFATRVKVYNVDSANNETLLTTINLTDGEADKELCWASEVPGITVQNRWSSLCWKLKFKKECEQLSNHQVTDLGTDTRYIGPGCNSPTPPT